MPDLMPVLTPEELAKFQPKAASNENETTYIVVEHIRIFKNDGSILEMERRDVTLELLMELYSLRAWAIGHFARIVGRITLENGSSLTYESEPCWEGRRYVIGQEIYDIDLAIACFLRTSFLPGWKDQGYKRVLKVSNGFTPLEQDDIVVSYEQEKLSGIV